MKYPKFLINSVRKKSYDANSLPMPVNTVCVEAKCPNRGECFSKKTVTFLLLGNICTRNCGFCNIAKGKPESSPIDEREAIIETIKHFGLKYVVLTSVTRDDLKDGGASVFVSVMKAIRKYNPTIKIEVLVPDFKYNYDSINLVCNENPFVFNHNLELAPRIFSTYRPMGNFDKSLEILDYVKRHYANIHIKTGIMVGLGETKKEILELIELLRKKEIDSLTIGQYLQPNKSLAEIKRFVSPEEYLEYEQAGRDFGIKVIAGPLVRSSYMAENIFN